MINFLVSLILGAGIDSLYYFLYIKSFKDIQSKNVLLFIAILIGYILLNMLLQYNFYLYLAFDLFLFLLLKLFKVSNKLDLFVILIIDAYCMVCSTLCYLLIPNYFIAYAINKVVLFVPLLKKDKLKELYVLYKSLWNRNDKVKKPIKSLTLRNASLLVLNCFIVIAYTVLLKLILLTS